MAAIEAALLEHDEAKLIASLKGATIDSVDLSDMEGMTLYLDDGRALVITGRFRLLRSG